MLNIKTTDPSSAVVTIYYTFRGVRHEIILLYFNTMGCPKSCGSVMRFLRWLHILLAYRGRDYTRRSGGKKVDSLWWPHRDGRKLHERWNQLPRPIGHIRLGSELCWRHPDVLGNH